MYDYKVYIQGPLGYQAVYSTKADSQLEAEALVLRFVLSIDPRVRVLRTECLSIITSLPKVVPIHNVIPVDFKTGKRLLRP